MSRICSSSEDKRIGEATAYMLGLLLFHNTNKKSSSIFGMVKAIGYTQSEVFEALSNLQAVDLVESHVQRCLNRSRSVKLTENAKRLKVSDLFSKLNAYKPEEGLGLEDLKEIGKGAAALATML